MNNILLDAVIYFREGRNIYLVQILKCMLIFSVFYEIKEGERGITNPIIRLYVVSSASTFLSVVFLPGITGQFASQLPVIVSIAMVASMLM